MKASHLFYSLAPIDLRSVLRDKMLSWMIFIPIVIALVIRWGVPPLTSRLLEEYGLDLSLYYPAILAYFLILMGPVMFGSLVGFILLDERDDGTLVALQVTPLPLTGYLLYRIGFPMVLTVLLIFLLFPLAKLSPIGPGSLLLTALVAAPLTPLFALFYASFAENKVQGFALMKAFGALFMLPILAYFFDSPWALLLSLIPTYWPMKVYWVLEAGESPWPWAVSGLLYSSFLLWLLIRRFYGVLHR